MEAADIVGIFIFLGVALFIAHGISHFAFNFDLFGYLYDSLHSLFDYVSNAINSL